MEVMEEAEGKKTQQPKAGFSPQERPFFKPGALNYL